MPEIRDPDQPRHAAAGPSRRTSARLAAVQALYQVEMSGLSVGEVIREFVALRLTEDNDGLRLGRIDQELFGVLVRGVVSEVADLDDMLTAVLPGDWPVERLEKILRIILRAGVLELSQGPETPARVIIKEYVDLAHAFFDGREPGMVNGILDRIAHLLRPEEFDGGAAALEALPDTI